MLKIILKFRKDHVAGWY